ncbi:MAG: hypothetical protein RR248_00355 [Clostridia bacterium]
MLNSLFIILIIFIIAVVADLILWLIKRSNFFAPNQIYLNEKPTQTVVADCHFSFAFLLFVGVGIISIFVSINYVEVSNFIKSYLTETQVQFVREIISNITSGTGLALLAQTLASQIFVALSVSVIIYSISGVKDYAKIFFNQSFFTLNFKQQIVHSLFFIRRINLQFSRFNQ